MEGVEGLVLELLSSEPGVRADGPIASRSEEIAKLYLALKEEGFKRHDREDLPPDDIAREQNRLMRGFSLMRTVVILARRGEAYIGITVAYLIYSTYTEKSYPYVEDMWVEPRYRKQKIATAMLERLALCSTEDLKLGRIALWTTHNNAAAQQLYQGFGFKCIGPHMELRWTVE